MSITSHEELLKEYVSKHYYIDYDGVIRRLHNETYELSEKQPEIAYIFKQFVTDNWQKEEK